MAENHADIKFNEDINKILNNKKKNSNNTSPSSKKDTKGNIDIFGPKLPSQGAGNPQINKPELNSTINQSGVAIAPPIVPPIVRPITPPLAVPAANPWIIGAEIIIGNLLFTPTVVSEGDLTPEQVLQDRLKEKAKADALTQTITIAQEDSRKGTIIYRWGSYTNKNFTPKEGKDEMGMSFSLTLSVGQKHYCATTLELVNATGYLKAVEDKPGHVSVTTTDLSKMPVWIASRDNADTDPLIYTSVLKSISIPLK